MKGWIMPQKAGMISARADGIGLATSGSGLMGLPGVGNADIGIDTNTPDGQLISTVSAGGAPAARGGATAKVRGSTAFGREGSWDKAQRGLGGVQ
jgi:hypothetical protein